MVRDSRANDGGVQLTYRSQTRDFPKELREYLGDTKDIDWV